MGFARTRDGARIFYKDWGGDGDPVLLIPGQGGSHKGWEPTVPHLLPTNRVISFDHRGVGQSDDIFPDEWSTRMFAVDAMSVVDELELGSVHVYGRSMGGRVAQWVGIDNQDRVASLVLGCTSPGGVHGIPRTEHATDVMLHGDRQANLELAFSPDWLEDHPQTGRTIGPRPLSERAREMHFDASRDHDSWDLLPTITSPTLIVHGTDDELCPVENAALLQARIREAEVYLVPGARHGFGTQFPEVEQYVGAFFTRHAIAESRAR